MRVENHTERITKIPIMHTSPETKNVSETDNVTLLPGVNDVDPKKWEIVKEYSLVKDLIEAGRRGRGFVVGDPEKSLRTLGGLDEKEAVFTVQDTVDVKLLGQWKSIDRRAAVLAAIAVQLEKIDPRRDMVNAAKS